MPSGRPEIDHLLRRAGFGASPAERAHFHEMSLADATDHLVEYERLPDEVDAKIGKIGYLATSPGFFAPSFDVNHGRQRWLFRMVHSTRPLQEKMALFWHNHFATAYSKIAIFNPISFGEPEAMMLVRKSSDYPGRQGQLELFRQYAVGKFRELLVEVARDPAMLVWLDGRDNTRERPQENFGREIMELFTFGIGHYTEEDVYAAARVFTGWSIFLTPDGNNYAFVFHPDQHETAAKTFTFAIYSDGGRTIPARPATDGMQDGIDLITALAFHPDTARRLARKLWTFFVSDVNPPDAGFVEAVATVYLQNDTDMKVVVNWILRSPWFLNPAIYYTRYAWPVEFVVRAIKEIGWLGFSVARTLVPLVDMGQQLYEPPNVAGWVPGQAWFSAGTLLARVNFAVTLAADQRFNLARDAGDAAGSPQAFLDFMLDRLSPAPIDRVVYDDLLAYVRSGDEWTGTEPQLAVKAAGVARLIAGSSEYQFQ